MIRCVQTPVLLHFELWLGVKTTQCFLCYVAHCLLILRYVHLWDDWLQDACSLEISSLGVRIRGTLGNIDPLNRVPIYETPKFDPPPPPPCRGGGGYSAQQECQYNPKP